MASRFDGARMGDRSNSNDQFGTMDREKLVALVRDLSSQVKRLGATLESYEKVFEDRASELYQAEALRQQAESARRSADRRANNNEKKAEEYKAKLEKLKQETADRQASPYSNGNNANSELQTLRDYASKFEIERKRLNNIIRQLEKDLETSKNSEESLHQNVQFLTNLINSYEFNIEITQEFLTVSLQFLRGYNSNRQGDYLQEGLQEETTVLVSEGGEFIPENEPLQETKGETQDNILSRDIINKIHFDQFPNNRFYDSIEEIPKTYTLHYEYLTDRERLFLPPGGLRVDIERLGNLYQDYINNHDSKYRDVINQLYESKRYDLIELYFILQDIPRVDLVARVLDKKFTATQKMIRDLMGIFFQKGEAPRKYYEWVEMTNLGKLVLLKDEDLKIISAIPLIEGVNINRVARHLNMKFSEVNYRIEIIMKIFNIGKDIPLSQLPRLIGIPVEG